MLAVTVTNMDHSDISIFDEHYELYMANDENNWLSITFKCWFWTLRSPKGKNLGVWYYMTEVGPKREINCSILLIDVARGEK